MADLRTELLSEHTFLVQGREDGDPVEVRVVVEPDFTSGLGLDGVDDMKVVDATVGYLLEHQRLDELPPQLYLEDVAAAYADFEEHLRLQLMTSSSGSPQAQEG